MKSGRLIYYLLILKIKFYKIISIWNRIVGKFLIKEKKLPITPMKFNGGFYSYGDMKTIRSFFDKK